jgi:pyrroline-5-carboxylate reductase
MNQAKTTNLGIFGLGNMGQAIFKLLQNSENGKYLNFYICSVGLKKIKNAVCLNSLDQLINKCDIIFLCIKPQDFYNLKPAAPNNKIFISIMAGVNLKNIKKIVNSQNVIRVMPNLPLRVGQSIMAWFADEKKFTKRELVFIKKLFLNFGYSFKVKTENDLDKITAISGSGPAYVFLFINALIKSAINLGFSFEQAEIIVLKLMQGSIKYYETVKNFHSPEELINMVKSKKGTTEAALNKLNINKFYKEWQVAVMAAYKRAKKISKYDKK